MILFFLHLLALLSWAACCEILILIRFCVFAGSSYARSSVVTAVKFTISDQPQPIDPLLKNCIGKMLALAAIFICISC